jgi:hypothetical protein
MPSIQALTTESTKQAFRCLQGIALFVLCSLPSVWLLTQPFPWITGLEAMALSTVVPLVVFGLIGGLRLVWSGDKVSWLECAAITLCFTCLQAYIFNTALHPANRFNLIGGLLPNADPSLYLSLANQWSDGMRVITPQTTRHLFPCFLSTMLWLCDRNLKMIVSLFTLITGVVSFLAWRQVRIMFGWLGATLFVSLVFFFYRCEVVGLLRTEQLGLWFALIALALLLQGLREKREGLWCTGLFSLVMALNTRAGAYFILPLLILYSGWIFPRGRWGWRSVFAAGAICFIGMLLNLAGYWIFFAPPRPTSNFWLCFYGMLKGGNWVSAMNEIGPPYDRVNLIARNKGMTLLRAEPWLVLKGFWRACVFVWTDNTFYWQPPTSETFRSWMKWLTVLGAAVPWGWSLVQKRRADLEWFVLLIVLGVVISLPFAPPWDGGHRVYAVAFPFLYLSPAMLIAWSWQELRNFLPLRTKSGDAEKNLVTNAGDRVTHLTQGCLGILLLLSTVVPLGLMLLRHNTISGWSPQFCVPLPEGCPAKNLPTGYQIHLISDAGRTFVPWVTVSDFRRSIDGNFEKLRAPWLLDLLNDLPEGTTIGTACHSSFFVIGTDKARTTRISRRHPILNRAWHRLIYDNEYPLSPYSRQMLSQPQAPPLPPSSNHD